MSDFLEEIYELVDVANVLRTDALQDGLDAGYRGKWRTQSFEEHIDHAIIHLLKLRWQVDDGENHLAHAHTRLEFAAIQEPVFEDVQKSGVDDGRRGDQSQGVERSEAVGEVSGAEWATHRSGLEPRGFYGPVYCPTCKYAHPTINHASGKIV